MKAVVHAVAGTLAWLIMATFWVSSVLAEVFLDPAAVVAVKHAIVVYGLAALVLAMASTGGSGFALAGARTGRLLARKRKRMLVVALNGVLVMVPSAIFLNLKAGAGEFDALFYGVQGIELSVGLVQLTMMAANFRDGLILGGRLRRGATRGGARSLSSP